MRVFDIKLCHYLAWCRLKLIDGRRARKVQVEIVIVQRLPHSSIGAIWHDTVIPVVEVFHCLALELEWRILAPGPIKVGLDKYGQMGPTDWRASLLRQLEHAALGTVRSVGWPA